MVLVQFVGNSFSKILHVEFDMELHQLYMPFISAIQLNCFPLSI